MKRFWLLAALISPASVYANQPGELTFPSLSDQWKSVQEQQFNDVVHEVQTHDYFAGSLFVLTALGKTVTVDRRAEVPKKGSGVPPPNLASLGDLLNGMSAEARGQARLEVHRTFREGPLKSEDWVLSFGGSWRADKEPNAPLPKSEEETGQ